MPRRSRHLGGCRVRPWSGRSACLRREQADRGDDSAYRRLARTRLETKPLGARRWRRSLRDRQPRLDPVGSGHGSNISEAAFDRLDRMPGQIPDDLDHDGPSKTLRQRAAHLGKRSRRRDDSQGVDWREGVQCSGDRPCEPSLREVMPVRPVDGAASAPEPDPRLPVGAVLASGRFWRCFEHPCPRSTPRGCPSGAGCKPAESRGPHVQRRPCAGRERVATPGRPPLGAPTGSQMAPVVRTQSMPPHA